MSGLEYFSVHLFPNTELLEDNFRVNAKLTNQISNKLIANKNLKVILYFCQLTNRQKSNSRNLTVVMQDHLLESVGVKFTVQGGR